MTAFGGMAATAAPPAPDTAIQLHVDLDVDPAKEKDLVANFKKSFRPTISKQAGFVDVKLLKFREAKVGTKPPGSWSYRLLISFQTEELRTKWVASDDHQKVWPQMEGCLKGAKYAAMLYDVA
jgi:heme-degrading monooxygenase HmoA